VGEVLKASPDAVKHAYRRVNKKADKVSKSLVTGWTCETNCVEQT
jgi:hypothetical protein